jgi:hypothetical protein
MGIETIDRLPSRLTTIDYGTPPNRQTASTPESRRDRLEQVQSSSPEQTQRDASPDPPAREPALERHAPAISDVLEAKLEDAWYRFERQALQVNQISSHQELAVLELRAIALEVETLWNGIIGNEAVPQSLLRVDQEATAVLDVQPDQSGAWWLTQRSIDWQRSRRYAQSTAAALRDIEQRRTERYYGEFSSPKPSRRRTEDESFGRSFRDDEMVPSHSNPVLESESDPGVQSTRSPIRSIPEATDEASEASEASSASSPSLDPFRLVVGVVGGSLQRLLNDLRRSRLRGTRHRSQRSRNLQKSPRIQRQSPRVNESSAQFPTLTIQDAAMWIAGAAAVRIILNIVLITQPALKPLFLMVMVAPAAIAIYQVTTVPKAGFVTAYRLLLMMIGLLLGGRLG